MNEQLTTQEAIERFNRNKQTVLEFLSKIHLVELKDGQPAIALDTSIEMGKGELYAIFNQICMMMNASVITLSGSEKEGEIAVTDLNVEAEATVVDLFANRLAATLSRVYLASDKKSDIFAFGDIEQDQVIYGMFKVITADEYKAMKLSNEPVQGTA